MWPWDTMVALPYYLPPGSQRRPRRPRNQNNAITDDGNVRRVLCRLTPILSSYIDLHAGHLPPDFPGWGGRLRTLQSLLLCFLTPDPHQHTRGAQGEVWMEVTSSRFDCQTMDTKRMIDSTNWIRCFPRNLGPQITPNLEIRQRLETT